MDKQNKKEILIKEAYLLCAQLYKYKEASKKLLQDSYDKNEIYLHNFLTREFINNHFPSFDNKLDALAGFYLAHPNYIPNLKNGHTKVSRIIDDPSKNERLYVPVQIAEHLNNIKSQLYTIEMLPFIKSAIKRFGKNRVFYSKFGIKGANVQANSLIINYPKLQLSSGSGSTILNNVFVALSPSTKSFYEQFVIQKYICSEEWIKNNLFFNCSDHLDVRFNKTHFFPFELFNRRWLHSHTTSSHSTNSFQPMCLGNSELGTNLRSWSGHNEPSKYLIFWLMLGKYLEWESALGGPYTFLSDVKRDYYGNTQNEFSYSRKELLKKLSNSITEKTFKEIVEKTNIGQNSKGEFFVEDPKEIILLRLLEHTTTKSMEEFLKTISISESYQRRFFKPYLAMFNTEHPVFKNKFTKIKEKENVSENQLAKIKRDWDAVSKNVFDKHDPNILFGFGQNEKVIAKDLFMPEMLEEPIIVEKGVTFNLSDVSVLKRILDSMRNEKLNPFVLQVLNRSLTKYIRKELIQSKTKQSILSKTKLNGTLKKKKDEFTKSITEKQKLNKEETKVENEGSNVQYLENLSL